MYSPAEKRSGAIADVVLPAGNPAQHRKASALGPIAYIVSRYPLLTETFILREMLELERQDVRLELFPLLRERPDIRHAELQQLAAPIHYTAFLSHAIVAANIAFLRRDPRRYLRVVWMVLRGNWGSANLLAGALGIFPKSVYFARLAEAHGIRHVHAHFATHPALSALIISELTGVDFSFTAHAHDIFLHEHMLAEKVEKARFVVAISAYNKDYILHRASRVDPDKIRVVHCGIDPHNYRAHSDAREAGFTVVCVASLQAYKGLKYLVRACRHVARRVTRFRCLIVGEGADRRELEALIGQLRLGEIVQLLGARPQHEVAEILGDADLFVLPSVVASSGQMDGIPVALMEAMACGLPVVSTRLSGIPELIEEGKSGLLVEPADELALAEAIKSLCDDPALRRQIGAFAREKVSADFGLSANVDRLRSLFEESSSAAHMHRGLDAHLVRWVKKTLRAPTSAAVRYERLGSARDSEVFEVRARGGREAFVLKLHRPHWALASEAIQRGRPHAENEFRALISLWQTFAGVSARLSVPRPVGFMPEQAALLMEKCPGERLSDRLRWARMRPRTRASLARWFSDCGEWLATLHRRSVREGDCRAVFEKIETEFQVDLEECVGRGLPVRFADSALRRFEAGKNAACGASSELVSRHCDFAAYNVLVCNDGVSVIDFEGLQEGIAYEDLCYFLCMLEATPAYHLSRATIGMFRDEFLRGYQMHAELDRETLELFMLAAMVKVMAHSPALRLVPGWFGSLKRRHKLRLFRRWFSERLA